MIKLFNYFSPNHSESLWKISTKNYYSFTMFKSAIKFIFLSLEKLSELGKIESLSKLAHFEA